jgi:superfamily II DNA or RNA helicase
MTQPQNEYIFQVGEIVSLRAELTTGAVIEVLPGEPEYRYRLFINGTSSLYYASQLQPSPIKNVSAELLPLSEFQARLTALQIRQPSLSNLYSLHTARINFVPYQFRPVLRFIRSDRPRLLIADEVGVGKTIEAGLILRELQARRDIHSVLILCPKPLVTERKWQLEMKRFDEDFAHLDGPTLRHCLRQTDRDGLWPDRYAKCILPFSLFDERLIFGGRKQREIGLLALDPPPRFDLVIVDEIHHARNTNTYLYQAVRFFVENADAAVFLSATPLQLHSNDLFVLLNLLRPDLILDRQSFQHMAEPNPFIHYAVNVARAAVPDWQVPAHQALRAAGETAWGKIMLHGNADYQWLCEQTAGDPLPPQERLTFIRHAENLSTFAHLINRTRRRDIGNFTMRKAETVEVQFTPQQRTLHDTLLAVQARILRHTHDSRTIMFLMTTLRRQAASCIYGLAPLIEQILKRGLAELELDEADVEEVGWNGDVLPSLADEIQSVLAMARSLDSDDPKLNALLHIVHEKQALPNNKILLFSSFRHTLRYLLQHLTAHGVRVGLIHGDVPDEERITLRERFSQPAGDPNAIDVLLSSEVGCEGLDYQFCDCLVNYDLPWNPMRVEQRIGRLDRYGQQSETVAIYNVVTPGTVDFDIYDRCLLRIGLFRQALGGSEEILGRITRELRSVVESLELTAAERQERLQQLTDNEIRLLQEQERLEEQQAELFGIVLPPQQIEQEIQDASSAWLTPQALQNLVQTYLTATCGGDDHILGERPLKTLRLSQEARHRLLEDLRKLPRQTSPLYREWEKWLKGGEYRLDITFDATCAAEHRHAIFIMPIHPLAQQAALIQQDRPPFHTAFAITSNEMTPGVYPFAIYQWEKRGVREDSLLQPVLAEAYLTDKFLACLERARAVTFSPADFPQQAIFDALESEHYKR